MRTSELLREYERNGIVLSDEPWMILVRHAAELLNMAKKMRNTERVSTERTNYPYIQDDLFGNDQEERR